MRKPPSLAHTSGKPLPAAMRIACVELFDGRNLLLRMQACACDMRYASVGAGFSIKEIDLAIVADIGTLNRLPKLIGDAQCRCALPCTALHCTALHCTALHCSAAIMVHWRTPALRPYSTTNWFTSVSSEAML